MKALIIGGHGLLGSALVEAFRARGHEAVPASRASKVCRLEVTDRKRISDCLEETRPDLVVNCAAITSIEACESDPGRAYLVNAWPAAELARHADRSGFRLVQISSDHFFSGDGPRRHDEAAPVTLVNEYARSKYAAERFALLSPTALVIRTAFVGRSPGQGRGFADWIVDSLRRGSKIVLFEDAWTSLLHAADAAQAIAGLALRRASGVVNVASRDAFSKADLIRGIAGRMKLTLNGRPGSVAAQQVPRAESLALDPARAEGLLGERMPSLEETVERLAAEFAGPLPVEETGEAGA